MKLLGKADLFNATWPAPVRVEVPELGGHLFVRVLAAGELDSLEEASMSLVDGEARPNFGDQRGRVVALCACDEAGVRTFSDDDAKQLSSKPGVWIDRVYAAACRVNRAGREEAKKNSPPPPA